MKAKLFVLAVLLATTHLFAADFKSGDLFYNLKSDGTVEVVTDGGFGSEYKNLNSIVIPKTVIYQGVRYTVTSIGERAFMLLPSSSKAISVTIPNTIHTIGPMAFRGRAFDTLVIPASVTRIRWGAFAHCMLNSIVVDEWNPVYDSRENCNAIIETATNSLIRGCYNTQIPSSVTHIGDFAFSRIPGMTSLIIPTNVTTIGESAFAGCRELTSMTIPVKVTSIGKFAFEQCKSLKSIIIPNNVVRIGLHTFYNCINLKSVVIGNSVREIGQEAFAYCSSLVSINIPNGITELESGSFEGCTSLSSITIPNSVKTIGNGVFADCKSLTSIVIPDDVEYIEDGAFAGCINLTTVTVGCGVESMKENVFTDCSKIKSVFWNAINCFCWSSFDHTSPFADAANSITSFTFGNKVENIPSYLCYGFTKVASFNIPTSVKTIGEYALSVKK